MLSKIQNFPFKEIHLKMSSGWCQPFCLSPNVLKNFDYDPINPLWNESYPVINLPTWFTLQPASSSMLTMGWYPLPAARNRGKLLCALSTLIFGCFNSSSTISSLPFSQARHSGVLWRESPRLTSQPAIQDMIQVIVSLCSWAAPSSVSNLLLHGIQGINANVRGWIYQWMIEKKTATTIYMYMYHQQDDNQDHD